MKILLIGSGGREHAMAWKIAQSPLCSTLFIAPGNPGTADLGTNVALDPNNNPSICAFCQKNNIDLVMVGPEVPLANGLVDELQNNHIKAFGPTQAAAKIESSKHFSKEFMQQFNIPTAKFETFSEPESAKHYITSLQYKYVIKAGGLTAGKGVFLPDSYSDACQVIDSIMTQKQFGDAGDEIIIEERLEGPEISLMAFADGHIAIPMLPAQDHKRLLDGQKGPNTGGMGAYAPVPFCSPGEIHQMMKSILNPAIQGLKEIGCPFVGILYAGLMLTEQGPKVLEFNCRFGDPETQVVLPLLDSDLVQIVLDCIDGKLGTSSIVWKNQSAVTVVLASGNYPGKITPGIRITLPDQTVDHCTIFHAGTAIKDNQLVTSGGRVLNITGVGKDLSAAIHAAYQGVKEIYFEGMQFRTDIGIGANPKPSSKSEYESAGVNINAGQQAIKQIKQHVQSTYNQHVLSDLGSFGGLFSLDAIKDIISPVLVASTDGVGTKVKLAAQYQRLEGIGADIVNHCIDDILVQGAQPLFFLNYYATSKLIPDHLEQIITGMAKACKTAGCVILGGETAEMPGVYCEGEFDVAGTIVGVVSKMDLLPKPDINPGDLLIGLASSGPHTNGYSLIRKIFSNEYLDRKYQEINGNLAEALLRPHRNYFPMIKSLLAQKQLIKGLAHITGGGFYDNIPRVLPESCGVAIKNNSWPVPELFRFIQKKGNVSEAEMFRVFNMGIGLIIIANRKQVETIQNSIPEETWIIGEVTNHAGMVEFHD